MKWGQAGFAAVPGLFGDAGSRSCQAGDGRVRPVFPGCPGADVAVSHIILVGKARGPKTSMGAAVQGAGGPRAGFPVGPAVPSPYPMGAGLCSPLGHICRAGGTLLIARNPRVPV